MSLAAKCDDRARMEFIVFCLLRRNAWLGAVPHGVRCGAVWRAQGLECILHFVPYISRESIRQALEYSLEPELGLPSYHARIDFETNALTRKD